MSPKSSKPPAKPRQYHHGGLREELLRLGLADLESYGASKVSLRDLATRAGVSKTAPYRHFVDREALLSALMQIGWSALRAAMADATDSVESPTDKLFAMGRAYVGFALERPGMYRLLFSGDGKSLSGSVCSESDDSFALLVAQIVACQATGWRADTAPETLALSYWSLVHGAADLALEGLVQPPSGMDTLGFWSKIVEVLQP
ncbi:MAG: TetR/AcrR family transcriptional regulator [Fibrobacterota bacterium]